MNVVRAGPRASTRAVKAQLMETYQGQTEEAMGLSRQRASASTCWSRSCRATRSQAAAERRHAGRDLLLADARRRADRCCPREKAEPLVRFLESLGHVTVAIIELVMKLAPLGVFCLIFSVTARFGFDLLVNLASTC